jgi:hypothetical protein
MKRTVGYSDLTFVVRNRDGFLWSAGLYLTSVVKSREGVLGGHQLAWHVVGSSQEAAKDVFCI